MLHDLIVENYAVVDKLRVRFHSGLNLLTGETGSGKSIVVDALGLLLGGRASAEMIRSGAASARVSGVFDLTPGATKILEAAGIDFEDDLVIEREIQATGKSRAFVNNRPATVAVLRDLAPHLGDIHGQHDQQLLFDPAAQLTMLDAFAQNRELRASVREVFTAWKSATAGIAEIESAEQEKARLLDLWQFQKQEIEAAGLQPGEDVTLDAERRVQQNAGKLLETASAAYESLYEAPESAWSVARTVARNLDELARIDAAMEPVRQTLEPALIAMQDVSFSLRDYVNKLEADPARLEEIENRLAAIDKLKRKFGQSLDEILACLEDITKKIQEVETSGERLVKLREDVARLATEYMAVSAELTASRKASAQELSKRVESELRPLAMERTVFRIEITATAWSESGADKILFLVSPNQGEEPKAMDKIASGGELSRIALALKTCLTGSSAGGQRTLVFDEIDTGIGGRAAEGVARRLKRLAAEEQVICVTHLAQIACFADHHYKVGKSERNGRTVAAIEELNEKTGTEEIGRMLSGETLTPEALKNAAELMRAARA